VTPGKRTSVDTRPAVSPRAELAAMISKRALIFIGVFVILAVVFHLQSDGLFLTPRNISLLLRQSAILAVVAAGVAMLMMMSEIDLSIGSAVFLCGVVTATLVTTTDLPTWLVVAAAICVGIVLGAVHGFNVVVLGIPSFIATLAGLLAFRGIGLTWTEAATIGPVSQDFIALSESFIPPGPSYAVFATIALVGIALVYVRHRPRRSTDEEQFDEVARVSAVRPFVEFVALVVPLGLLAWAVGGFLGIPMALVWVAVVVLALVVLMGRTTFGRNAYLTGANREAALYSGINVKRQVFVGFMVMGALYGVGGVLLTARIGSSTPGAGEFMELDAIAAAVIGGVSLRGGTGTVAGAVMGAVLLTLINNGMSLLNVTSFTQGVVKAVILILALALDAYFQRRGTR
jgi:D-xylose transport system permease protein